MDIHYIVRLNYDTGWHMQPKDKKMSGNRNIGNNNASRNKERFSNYKVNKTEINPVTYPLNSKVCSIWTIKNADNHRIYEYKDGFYKYHLQKLKIQTHLSTKVVILLVQ